jgi:hypothetical protein
MEKTMIDTRTMDILELYNLTNKPMWELGENGRKAIRVKERREREWLKANPDKTQDDWIDTWYPGGHAAYNKMMDDSIIAYFNSQSEINEKLVAACSGIDFDYSQLKKSVL